MSETKCVLIVGAGPTGMTAAMELTRLGISVRIVDKLTEPSTTSRALAIQARTLELFAQRGLVQEMLQIGNQGVAAAIYGKDRLLGKVHLKEIPSRYNYILLLSQAETERILREQLDRQGIAIERGTEVIALAQPESSSQPGQSGGVRAVLRDRKGNLEEIEAAYLISAEGAHSLTRHTLGLEFAGRSLGESYALADLHLDSELPDDELSIFLGEHGFLAVFPMGARHFRFIATESGKPSETGGEPTLQELQQLYNENAPVPARLRDMTWSSRFRINSRMLSALHTGRIFFGGDAAHIHSPAGGQGMNTGIQDMINLSWKLALVMQGKAAPELLNTYEEDRLPIIRGIVTKTELPTNAFNSQNVLVHQLIAHIAPVLLNAQFVQRLTTGMISEVTAGYRASALSRTHHAPGDLCAGDRLPDCDVLASYTDKSLDALPQSARLYELLDPSRLTLLIVRGQEAAKEGEVELPPDATEQLTPWKGLLQVYSLMPPVEISKAESPHTTCFGGCPGIFLVRPDSYIGFAGGKDDWPALIQWLNQWFPPLPG